MSLRQPNRIFGVQLALGCAFASLLVLVVLKHTFVLSAVDRYVERVPASLYPFYGCHWPLHLLAYPLLLSSILGALLFMRRLAADAWRSLRLGQHLRRVGESEFPAQLQGLLDHLDLRGSVDLLRTDERLAFTYGLLRPRICLSTGAIEAFNVSELEALLLHENQHRLNLDPLKMTLTRSLASALFFLPVLRDLQMDYDIAKELAADRSAVEKQTDAAPLAAALLKALAAPGPACRPAVGAGSAPSILTLRIQTLVKAPPTPSPLPLSRRTIVLAAILGLALLAFLILPGPSPSGLRIPGILW